MTFHAWPVLFPTSFLLSAMPGRNNLLAAANGLRFGVGTAAAAAAGRVAAFAVVKWCGVAYLARPLAA